MGHLEGMATYATSQLLHGLMHGAEDTNNCCTRGSKGFLGCPSSAGGVSGLGRTAVLLGWQ